MAILESVRELASKLGADTNGRTIADQINIINRHLEADTANDIAGAVKEYSKKAGSGGGGETFEVELDYDSTNNKFLANKTCQEVVTAYDDGMIIKLTNSEAVEQMMQQAGLIAVDKPYAYDKETISHQLYDNILWFNWAVKAGGEEIFPIYWSYSSDFSEEIINISQQ